MIPNPHLPAPHRRSTVLRRAALATAAAVVSLLAGCAAGDAERLAEPPPATGEVRVYGELRRMMNEGRTAGQVALQAVLPNPRLYAVGALEDLAGEVTVVGGRTYLSYAEADSARVETPSRPTVSAALLVAAEVPEWQTVTADRAIGFAELDERLGALAAAAGLRPDQRFPFLIEGDVEDLRWHVIYGRRLDAGAATHEDHRAAGVVGRLDRTRATLVGFHSRHDQGVFTHMGSLTHVHCVIEEPRSTGHVDHVVLPAGTTIRLPAVPGRTDEPAAVFAALEERLLQAGGLRIGFAVTAEGAVAAELRGELRMQPGGAVTLTARGSFAGAPVALSLVAGDGSYMYGSGSETTSAASPPHLREALLIGLTRMGILHNLAMLSGGAPPDRAAGGVRDWVEVGGFARRPGAGPAGPVEFDITVAGEPVGSASLLVDPLGRPVERRQTVQFPSGEMRVVERYSRVSIDA